jgi:hypothetical protein
MALNASAGCDQVGGKGGVRAGRVETIGGEGDPASDHACLHRISPEAQTQAIAFTKSNRGVDGAALDPMMSGTAGG